MDHSPDVRRRRFQAARSFETPEAESLSLLLMHSLDGGSSFKASLIYKRDKAFLAALIDQLIIQTSRPVGQL